MQDAINSLVLLSNFLLVPGITYGCQLALGALGITLVFSNLSFSNIAHGDTMAFGAMVTIFCTWGLQTLGLNIFPLPTALLALPFGILATVALVLGTDRLVYRKFRRDKASPTILLIASVGVMFVMNAMVRFIIGPDDQVFTDGARFIISAREFKASTGLKEGLAIKTTQGISIVVTLALVAALFWFLNSTRTGKSMRAYADNEDLALLSGINPERVVALTWIIAGALTATAGVLYGLDKSFKPFTYFSLLLPMFAAAIVGGFGKPLGAIVGGFIIALSEVILTYAYKKFLSYWLADAWRPEGLAQLITTEYKFAISFAILVIVLIIKPTGIFKGRVL